MVYEEQLARLILEKFPTEKELYYPSISKDNEFIKYEDSQISIVAAVNTKALCITIYPPLTEAQSNPITFIDDEGKCYRNHGERTSFNLYAENLLGLPRKTFFNEWSKEKEERILDTLKN
jgi:hypothetical protein